MYSIKFKWNKEIWNNFSCLLKNQIFLYYYYYYSLFLFSFIYNNIYTIIRSWMIYLIKKRNNIIIIIIYKTF